MTEMTAAWQSEVVTDGQPATPTHNKGKVALLPAGTPCMQSPLSCLQCKVAQALSSWLQTTLTCIVSRHSQEQNFYLLSSLVLLKLKTFSSQRKSPLPLAGMCLDHWLTQMKSYALQDIWHIYRLCVEEPFLWGGDACAMWAIWCELVPSNWHSSSQMGRHTGMKA